MTPSVVVAALLIAVGLFGIVVPVLPGLLIAVAGVVVWVVDVRTPLAWTVLAVVVALYAAGLVAQYLIPGRHLKARGVGRWTLLIAMAVAIVGFFVVPVVGAPLGFVVAIYVVELAHTRATRLAWDRTKAALVAVAKNMGIELVTGLLVATTFAIGVAAS